MSDVRVLNILVLDDDPERHVGFIRRLSGHNLVNVGNFYEAARALSVRSYDVVFLDHDLGEPRTGADVARFLVAKVPRRRWPKMIIIHSLNPVGARNIHQIIRSAGIPCKLEPYRHTSGGGWA